VPSSGGNGAFISAANILPHAPLDGLPTLETYQTTVAGEISHEVHFSADGFILRVHRKVVSYRPISLLSIFFLTLSTLLCSSSSVQTDIAGAKTSVLRLVHLLRGMLGSLCAYNNKEQNKNEYNK